MPAFDGTGPMGMGPGSGRGLGFCFGFGPGFRSHRGRGLGRYFRWNWPANVQDQKKSLADYRQALEEELEDVKKQESELEVK